MPLAVCLLAIGALLGTSACAANMSGTTPREVQATAVRRTAAAEVQRIIAGDLSGTPTPEATPTPVPSCAGAIWWHEARTHVGERRIVEGPVVALRQATTAGMLLEIG